VTRRFRFGAEWLLPGILDFGNGVETDVGCAAIADLQDAPPICQNGWQISISFDLDRLNLLGILCSFEFVGVTFGLH